MRIAIAAGLLALLMLPATTHAQIDHLEVAEAPRLVDCSDNRPYFRVVVNAVDAERKPVTVGLTPEEAKKRFHVLEGSQEHTVQYVGLFESGGQSASPGNYVMLLLDTSGSMNLKLPSSGETRFAAAKAAVSRTLANFVEGTDHFAVVPFDSHNVVSRIRGASFQATRRGVDEQLAALPAPRPNNNTALYTAIDEALPILKSRGDAGYVVMLVVFTDGENDVNHPGDDRGLLGPEGLKIVKDRAAELKVPITTVGFGVSGNATTVNALREVAWPNSDNYYNAETNAQRLETIFANTRRKLTDRIQILFGPVRPGRDNLAGQSPIFRVRLRTAQGFVSSRSEPAWEAPAVGVPVFETKCTEAELRVLIGIAGGTPSPQPPPPIFYQLVILAMFSALLAGLWFGAPRFVWPEAYIPKPTFNRPASGIPEVDGLRPPSFSPRGGPSPVSPPRGGQSSMPPSRGGAPAMHRPPLPTDSQTIVIPPRGPARPAAPPPRGAPRPPDPPDSRATDDETIYRPIDKDPRKGH
jgi:Mg-chelatase subunit ChlD